MAWRVGGSYVPQLVIGNDELLFTPISITEFLERISIIKDSESVAMYSIYDTETKFELNGQTLSVYRFGYVRNANIMDLLTGGHAFKESRESGRKL